MRVAVPTDDQVHISAHTGRCAGFLVFSVEDNSVKLEEHRLNTAGHGVHRHHGEHAEGHGQHNHAGMLAQLQGCDTVLAAGMGPRLVHDLEANGFKVVITNEPDATRAVEALVKGQLVPQPSRCRCCGH